MTAVVVSPVRLVGVVRDGGPLRRAGVLGLAHLGEDPLQLLLVVLEDLLGLLDRDVATTDEGLGVELAHRALLLDQVVHQRLGVRRVVALVVAAAAVADQVDDDVLVERLAVLERQPGHPDAGLGVVAVDVEDRRLHHPGDVGAVERGARRAGRGGEADLVVDDDVDGAAGAVAAQLGEVERLGDHALAGERRVAVDQQRQHGVLGAPVEHVLLGAGDALEHRVDGLEVGRVRRDRDLDRGPRSPATNSPSAPRWYFTSPEPWTVRGSMLPSNSRKIWEYFLPTMLASTLSRPRWAIPMVTSSRPASAAASQISSISGIVVSPPSRLNRFWPTNLVCRKVSNASAWLSLSRIRSCSSRGGFGVRLLDALLDPAALLGVLDVHVLDAGGAAVGVAQDAEDVAQLHEAPALAAERAGGELAVEVPQRQPVRLDLEVGVAALAVLQRVGVGHHVAAHPVGVDQLEDPRLLADLVVVARSRCPWPSGSARRGCAARGRSRRRSRPRRAAARAPGAGTHRTARPG